MTSLNTKKIREEFGDGMIVPVNIGKTMELVSHIRALLDEVERCHAKLKVAEDTLSEIAEYGEILAAQKADEALNNIREA